MTRDTAGINREAKGVPTGGQFAADIKPEASADVTLRDDRFARISEDEFDSNYRAIESPQGSLYFTADEIEGIDETHVWSILEADGVRVAAAGTAHEVNFTGEYLVTENPWVEGLEAEWPNGANEDAPQEIVPFVFDKNYGNHEQVRPFYDEYLQVRAELDDAGQYPYNDRFKGRIPSLDLTDAKNEETAIYMLQNLHSLDDMRSKIAVFEEQGAEHITEANFPVGTIKRGTVAAYGYYVGGTGWQTYENARLIRTDGGFYVLPKGKRTNGYTVSGKRLLLLEDDKK